MSINRRSFIRAAGSLAFAGVATSLPALASQQRDLQHKLRIGVFFEPSFPAKDGMAITRKMLLSGLEGKDAIFLNLQDLKTRLDATNIDVFLNPYGSAFPKDAWHIVLKYLREGGNFVNLGGVPFSVPVNREGGGWREEVAQSEYHKRLGITQAFPVKISESANFHSIIVKGEENPAGELKPEEIFELYVRFTSSKGIPDEDGSDGPRDAIMRPIVIMKSSDGRALAAPVIQIDRLQGDFAGGRWVLANFRGNISERGIRILVEMAARGAREFTVRSSFACYRAGERPTFTVRLHRPNGDIKRLLKEDCRLEITNTHASRIAVLHIPLHGTGMVAVGSGTMSAGTSDNLHPGLYLVDATVDVRSREGKETIRLHHTDGFWLHDQKLLAAGNPLAMNKDYFLRDGKPYPVTGTTYMGSDVHRKFLLEPNPYVWDQDFRAMKSVGVNMVRTGIWTGWKNYMLEAGVPNESALRAMDAFLLTARTYDLPVIFTFFAFLPEAWGGLNPYLDPRALRAQKEFVAAFAQRYSMMNDIMWDLINEPSFCSPQQLWLCRPNYDRFEEEAWTAWLKEKYPASSEEEWLTRLQELYRVPSDEALALPTLEEFSDVNIFEGRRPIKVIDYRLFAQDMFIRWSREMSNVIRSNGHSSQWITIGQDEGGTYERPGPQFFNEVVDFTCVHTWWYNDDLVWDNVMTRLHAKPNLIEETGVMFYEKIDGSAWRTEEEARNLLERKLAIAMGAGGAGYIQWIWNTNPYIPSDNEAAIGFLRADGTEKPELEVFRRLAKFFSSNKYLMNGRKEPDVVMLIPHSQMFSVRNFATEATKRCVRAMQHRLAMPMRTVSEYRLETMGSSPPLMLMPSPRTINEDAWKKLLTAVEAGSTLLVTGVIDSDDHWMRVQRSGQLGLDASVKAIAQEEFLTIDGVDHQLTYRGEKIQRIEKAVIGGNPSASVMTIPMANGKVIWSPLPVELSDDVAPTVALYEYALKQSGLSPLFSVDTNHPDVLILPMEFNDVVLCTAVSEGDRDTALSITHRESQRVIDLNVLAQRTAMMFVRRKDGEVIARCE